MDQVMAILMSVIMLFSGSAASNVHTNQDSGQVSVQSTNNLAQNNNTAAETIPQSTANKRVVAYFTSWSAYARAVTVADIDPTLLTHINFAFANLDSNGNILIGDSWVDVEKPFGNDTWDGPADGRGHFNQLKQLKEKYPALKTLISVGGWTWSNQFSGVAADEGKRKNFAKSAVDFITKYGFDGLDIDWEFPVEGGNNIPHLPQDKQNFTKLLQEVRAAFDEQEKKDGKHYLLTIAGGPNVSFTKNTELPEMIQYLDFINIMAYDYHGSWESVTGHNAPLYSKPENGGSVSETVEAYLSTGIPASSLNLGLAFYGKGWQNVGTANHGLRQSGTVPSSVGYGGGTWEAGAFDYWDIAENYVGKNGYQRYFDEEAKAPYLYNGSVFISYSDKESVQAKLQYADAKGLGGVMFWEFSGDKKKELQKTIAEYYQKGNVIHPETSNKTVAPPVTNQKTGSTVENTALPQWDKSAVYTGGSRVIYNNKIYEAKWWTQGDIPAESIQEWGPWKESK